MLEQTFGVHLIQLPIQSKTNLEAQTTDIIFWYCRKHHVRVIPWNLYLLKLVQIKSIRWGQYIQCQKEHKEMEIMLFLSNYLHNCDIYEDRIHNFR